MRIVCSWFKLFAEIISRRHWQVYIPGRIGQLVTCLTTDICLTADPGVTSSIPAGSHTFAEIDHEIISTAILLPSTDSRRVVVSYKRKCARSTG